MCIKLRNEQFSKHELLNVQYRYLEEINEQEIYSLISTRAV